MKILVTGAAGFMGSWLVDELIARGHDVTGIDNLSGGFQHNVNPACRFIERDLRDDIEDVVAGQEAIFHLAAYAAEGQSVFSPKEINDINIRPMNNLLVAAVNHGVKRFVFTSSMAVYGNNVPPFHESFLNQPEDPYGCSKAYCEQMLRIFARTYGLEAVIIRPHNVFGPRQNISDPYRNVLGIWMNMVMAGKAPFVYGDGDQVRAFSYIEDITGPLANALDCPAGSVINLGSPDMVTINEACRTLLDVMQSPLEPVHLEARPCEVKIAYCTTAESVRLLGYARNHTLRMGLEKMLDWAKDVGVQQPSYRIPLEITKNAPKVWREKMI